MFKSVLIAEDHQSVNTSVIKTLEEFQVDKTGIKHVYYCDHALSIIRMGIKQQKPIELLITDLSFEDDGTNQSIKDGVELIKAVRNIQPDIKIMVFSAKKEAATIALLYDTLTIDAYILKGRSDTLELQKALDKIYHHQERYIPPQIRQILKQEAIDRPTEYDLTLVSLLAEGKKQKEIAEYMKDKQIQPSGLSSIEKRLNHLKIQFECAQNGQLIAVFKDKGFI